MPPKFVRQLPHVDTARCLGRSSAGLAALALSAGLVVGVSPATAATTPQASHTPTARSDAHARTHHRMHALTDGLLAEGAKGSQVSQLQRGLHQRVTGRFGSTTRDAVIRFQRKHRLMVDGVVGPQTWDTLFHLPLPAAPAVTADTTPTSTYTSDYTSGGYSIPASIVQCESGGDYSAVNSSSGAGGAYQIMPSTWAAYGGQGLPQDASPAEQSAIAARIYATQGPSAWTC